MVFTERSRLPVTLVDPVSAFVDLEVIVIKGLSFQICENEYILKIVGKQLNLAINGCCAKGAKICWRHAFSFYSIGCFNASTLTRQFSNRFV